MSRYLKPRDHGYLMEAAACTKVLEDLRRIEAKYARTVEKEGAVRQAHTAEDGVNSSFWESGFSRSHWFPA